MKSIDQIIETAKQHPKHIVLAEGNDVRVIQAASDIVQSGLAIPYLIGGLDDIHDVADAASVNIDGVSIIDPTTSDKATDYAQALFEKRGHKGVDLAKAERMILDPLCYANMMVAQGDADGSVAGAVYTTSDVVRTAIQLIGVKKTAKMVSSFFLIMMDKPYHEIDGGLVFSDCGLVIDPNAEELSEIAIAAAESAQALLGVEPKVAMLSFSTSGSAKHPLIDKVVEATEMVKEKRPDLAIDGEVQLDAAIVPQIAVKKISDSKINGQANVLVFPNLEAGNIGYKMAERIGGATALGPLLQGLSKPANDLSRGCSAEDIYKVVAVTVNQSLNN